MAKNEVAKISVGIEAKVDGLAADLKKAEATVKTGAKNIEKTVESAASKMERSWTEAFSKIGVIMQLAQTIEQAFSAVSGVIKTVGNDSLNASQKIIGSMKAIEDSGIPIISTFVKIGHSIGDMIIGEEKLSAAILARQGRQLKTAQSFVSQQAQLTKLAGERKAEIAVQEHLNKKAKAATNEQRVLLQVGWERKKMQDELAATIDEDTKSNVNKMKTLIALNDDLTAAAEEGYAKRLDAARAADDAEKQSAADKAAAIAKTAEDEATARNKKDDELAAARIRKTKDLNSLVLQGELRMQGKVEDAEKESIRRSFEIRRQSATTKEQLGLLSDLERMEMGAVGGGVGGGGGGGGTTSIATAIGTFSMGTASPELKESEKQTVIQTQMLAALQNDGGGGAGLIVPAS